MSPFNRRQFLHLAGSTLATIGLSQVNFIHQADRYGRVLAQDTSRKRALLIGINQYESVSSLNGCITDVQLQKHLLMGRFGFQPEDFWNSPVMPQSLNLDPLAPTSYGSLKNALSNR